MIYPGIQPVFPGVFGQVFSPPFGGTPPWITDIQTGLSPGMTITGGPTYVADYLGTLRRTPAGYAAIEGGRYVTTVADGAVLGPELIVNGGFDTGLTPWLTAGTAPWSVVDGVLVNTLPALYDSVYQGPILTSGRLYRAVYTLISITGGGGVFIRIGNSGIGTSRNAVGIYTQDIISSGTVPSHVFFLTTESSTRVVIDNVSVREVIPQWLPAPAEPSILVPTRKGLRTVYNDPGYLGPRIEPASTNKCTCVKANPTATTNITKTGDAASVLSVVNDATALAAAGLDGVCTSGNVYKLDNTIGTTPAYAVIGGSAGNTNPHTLSVYGRRSGTVGANNLLNTTSPFTGIPFTGTGYARYEVAGVLNTITSLQIMAGAGETVYFILPQLEELPYCTSPIIGTDTAAAQTRAAVVTSAPTAGVFPASGQDFAVFIDCVPVTAGQVATLFSTRVDADNLFYVATTATMVGAVLRKTATDNAASAFYTHAAATKFQTIAIKTAMGMAVKCRQYSGGVWGAWTAWGVLETVGAKATSPIGTTYQIGALNGVNQFAMNDPLTAIIALPAKSTLAEYETWIETHLTQEGLI